MPTKVLVVNVCDACFHHLGALFDIQRRKKKLVPIPNDPLLKKLTGKIKQIILYYVPRADPAEGL